MSATPLEAFSRALKVAQPALSISSDPELLKEYGRDWTRVHTPAPSLLVRPKSTEEVQAVVQVANLHDQALVPSGGRTGLAGGAVAARGEVVVNLERMNRVSPVDVLGLTVCVGAGVITEAVHEAAMKHGLTWPIDFASKGSSQVGGNIATNAGGIRVIRFGLTRHWVLGLTVVTGAGEVLQLNGALEKNNTGVDLRQLFIGSEGTLGIITEAVLKLEPQVRDQSVYLFALSSLEKVLRLFERVRQAGVQLSAFEFFTDRCLARLKRHRGLVSPLETETSHYVVMERDRVDEHTENAFLESLFEDEVIEDGTRAESQAQARELWSLREGISESLSSTGLPHKNDISLPLGALFDFERELTQLFEEKYPSFEVCLFGHIGDGNLHVNVMKPDEQPKEAFLREIHQVDAHMFELVERHKGSISAEHGIGLLKKPWLHHSRSQEEIRLMRSMKSVFDPNGILNPGKVFDP